MKIIALAVFSFLVVVSANGQMQSNQPTPARPRPAYVPPPPRVLLSDVYAKLIGKTVLAARSMPDSVPNGLDLQDTNKAIQLIEAEFAKARFVPVQDGEKFVRMMRVGWDTPAFHLLPILKAGAPKVDAGSVASNNSISPGEIYFPAMDLNTFLDFYAKLSGRVVLRPPNISQPTIHLIAQTQMSRAEAIYAFEAVLALNSIAVTHDGERFVQVIDEHRADTIQTNAPARKPGEYKGSIAFPGKFNLDGLMSYYGTAKGKKIEISNSLGSLPIFVGLTGEMTYSELAYAIETILRFNGFSIVPVNDTTVTVVKSAGK